MLLMFWSRWRRRQRLLSPSSSSMLLDIVTIISSGEAVITTESRLLNEFDYSQVWITYWITDQKTVLRQFLALLSQCDGALSMWNPPRIQRTSWPPNSVLCSRALMPFRTDRLGSDSPRTKERKSAWRNLRKILITLSSIREWMGTFCRQISLTKD